MGPFLEAPGRVNFLIVVADYFTKWVKAEALVVISRNNVAKFVWKQIVCGFVLLHMIISDNGKIFTENPFKKWCSEKGIKQSFTSIAHLQANGQVEVTNRTLVKGIKKQLRKA